MVINISEFEKCGDIMFAAKRNKIALRCNFCEQIFTQLQSFVRHLHMEHTDVIGFSKQSEEMAVYAFEELINQTVNSCTLDIGTDTGLNESHKKWLDEDLSQSKEEGETTCIDKKDNEADDLNVTNTSILKALEDSDVSLSLIDKFNTVKCYKKERVSIFDNEGEGWDTRTSKETQDVEKLKTAPAELVTNNSFVEDNLNRTIATVEQSPRKRIKRLFQDFEDVGNLFYSLQSDTTSVENNKLKENTTIAKANFLLDIEKNSYKDGISCNNFSQIQCKDSMEKKVIIEANTSNTGPKSCQNFEASVQEMEIILDKDTFSNNNETNGKHIINTSNIINNEKPLNSRKSLTNLEESLTADAIDKKYNKVFGTDLGKDFANLNEPEILEKATFLNKNPLNEELTKALADALDLDGLDLLNLQLEEETDEPLNKDILELLERELLEADVENELQVPNHQQETPDTNSRSNDVVIEEKCVLHLQSERKKINDNESFKKSNYEETNLQVRKKMLEKNKSNPLITSILKESNCISLDKIVKDAQKLLKEPHEILVNLQERTSQISQNKTANKKNLALNVQQIRKENFTPTTSFINKKRSYKIPVKDEEHFLKQNPETEERQQPLIEPQQTPQSKNNEQQKKSQEKQNQPLRNNKMLNNNSKNSKSPQKPVTRSNKNLSTPVKTIIGLNHLYNGDRTVLTTPQRKLKNVAIKLQRCTPDKLANALRSNKLDVSEIYTKQIGGHFILPQQGEVIATLTKQFTENKVVSTLQKQENSQQFIQPVDIATQNKPNSTNKSPRHSNLDYKSYAVNRCSRKKEVLQRMRCIKKQIFKSIEESESLINFKSKPAPLIKSKKRENIIIENVKVLPDLDKKIFDNFKRPFLNNFFTSTKIFSSSEDLVSNSNSTNNEAEKNTKTTKQNNCTKRQHISPINQQIEEKSPTELERTQLDLSESCVDFLQRDLKASHLNVESLFNSEMSEGDGTPAETLAVSQNKSTSSNETFKDDVFEKVPSAKPTEEVARTENSADKTEASTNSHTIEDFDESKDIELLAKFGLKIIKLPEIEDTVLLEERDEMCEKAKQFANIYKNWPRIWSPKNFDYPTYKQELDKNFKGLLAETNTAFNLTLNMMEIKRLVNLINFWFAQNVCSRFIEKRKISDSTNRYLMYFFCIPKTTKLFYYCEYCEEYSNTEHKYYTHRMTHTECCKCSNGFKALKQLRDHQSSCNKSDA